LSDPAIVLCNAGPLIALGKLNRMELLVDLYAEVQITRCVYDEVVTRRLARGAPEALMVRLFWQRQGWPVVDVQSDIISAYTPSYTLDPGENRSVGLGQESDRPAGAFGR
jgi:predicted nucleic acid-binding protein